MRRFVHDLGLSGLLATAVLASATGCPDRPVAEIQPNPVKQNGNLIPVSTVRNLDILFIVDNSGSMAGEQAALNKAFPDFMAVLNNIEGGLPNVHIGVVSSNVGIGDFSIEGADSCQRPTQNGDNGALQNTIHTGGGNGTTVCSGLQGKFIIDEDRDGTRVRNYDTGIGLEQTFACMAELGTQGCGFEQHLESMRRALDNNGMGTSGQNTGFLRNDAYLALIFLADEDDCSATNNSVFDPSDSSFNGTLGPIESFRCTEFGITCDQGNLSRAAASYTGCKPRTDAPYMRQPVEYANWLKNQVKGSDPNLLIVSTIVGPPDPVSTSVGTNANTGQQVVRLNPSCDANPNNDPMIQDTAAPAVRLNDFRLQFTNNSFTSICQEDLTAGLQQTAQLLARVIGDRCIQGNIATEDLSDAPGLQLECSVEDVIKPNTDQETSETIRRCDMVDNDNPVDGQELPCWFITFDQKCNSNAGGYKFEVVRDGGDRPPQSYERFACVAE